MQLTVQKPKSSGYGTFIVCLVLVIVAAFFLVLPKYHAYNAAKQAEAQSQQSLDAIKAQQQQVNDILAKLKAKSDELGKVDQAIPDQPDIPDFYAYIESLAKSVNLTISTIQAKDETSNTANSAGGVGASAATNPDLAPASGASTGSAALTAGAGNGTQSTATSKFKTLSPTLGVVSMDLQVTGNLSDYISFLEKLQDSLRLIDVQSIDVAAAEGKSDLTFITNLSTYYQKTK